MTIEEGSLLGSIADRAREMRTGDLRVWLVEAGDRRMDASSASTAREARREQAVLISELRRRGEPLDSPPGDRIAGPSGLLPPGLGREPSSTTPARTERTSPRPGPGVGR